MGKADAIRCQTPDILVLSQHIPQRLLVQGLAFDAHAELWCQDLCADDARCAVQLREQPDGGLLDKLVFGVGVGHGESSFRFWNQKGFQEPNELTGRRQKCRKDFLLALVRHLKIRDELFIAAAFAMRRRL